MAESISSLYGPGAIICWGCTALSVLLSWSFNRSSQKYDTITNDFAGCLLLPAIAVTHLVYELARTNKGSKATLSMDSTFTMCMYFSPIGILLCAQALSLCQWRRLFLTAVVTVPCLTMELVVLATSSSDIPHFNKRYNALPLCMNSWALSACCCTWVWETVHLRKVRQITWLIFPLVLYLQWLGLSFNISEIREGDSSVRRFPRTPYSICDIDQAVALSVGIITLLLSIGDIVLDNYFSTEVEFEYWRVRCIQNIERGDTNVDITRWKQELESIDKKAKVAKTRAKHRKREQSTYAKFPEYLKDAISSYRDDRGLGIL